MAATVLPVNLLYPLSIDSRTTSCLRLISNFCREYHNEVHEFGKYFKYIATKSFGSMASKHI